jgi:hypothetical protein
MVHLQTMQERYGSDGLLVFAISMEPDPVKARNFNKELGVTYPVFNGYASELGERFAYG